ncbi:glycogen debranching protein [Flagellimonas nanhaiensis]|uniref:Glycogen debranching protein n=1 Tax=Flagellimonas nanhaiensis TaxID=2292706 RepID=A0A371JPW1_9FLAO|nr:glycogen debranching protein [Allomuricauda nanhaiensis]RDY59565.1 glycogen debranching protein [Allomuricauda nanhaiensis]
MKFLYSILLVLLLVSCSKKTESSISELFTDVPFIKGKDAYLNSPYVTAGDRVYMVGHQDGSFPPLGWHIKGEMGGIWNHPIKLMDGFETALVLDKDTIRLDNASEFVNYPFANKHIFEFPSKNLVVERLQFVPDNHQGIVIQFIFKSANAEKQNLQFEFIGHSDLRPTWLGERTNMHDNLDEAVFEDGKWIVKDSSNPWFNIFGSDQTPIEHHTITGVSQENNISNALTYDINLDANEPTVINFFISGSYQSREDALDTYNRMSQNHFDLLANKKNRYQTLVEQSKLTIPDKDLEQAFEWLKYNCDWLVRTVPEIGTGIGAGIPDYPWWFGVDSEYALKGYMAIGQEDIVHQTIQLLDSVSMAINGNGKILHEMSTNGSVFNEGNINETPQFASLIWEIYTWNGDKQFLEKYFPTVKKGLTWLMEENDSNKNLFPDGFGMMEIHGLDSEMIDVAAYTQRAFYDASLIAMELEESELAKEYKSLAAELRKKINDEFWSDEFESYADFLGTDEQAIHLIDDAIVRADTLNKPWAVEELQNTKQQILKNRSKNLKPFVLHHNWVVNTPMEMGIADSTKAITALNTAKKFTNPFGMFVTGIDRDDSAGKDFGSFKGSKVFSYTGAVMTLPTGVQAVAENNYGRPDMALDYLKRMTRTFSYALPGSIYEVSPDYGMMTQAWNIYAFAIPIVQQFFGIEPMANKKQVIIRPQMPNSWDNAKLENVKIADNEISISYKSDNGSTQIEVQQTNPDWELRLVLPKDTYTVLEGNAETFSEKEHSIFVGSGNKLVITNK